MQQAREKARSGSLDYFEKLPEDDLRRLCRSNDEDGRTILHTASTSGSMALLSFLAASGAADRINDADDEGWTPLLSAVSTGHEDVVKALLSLGADVHHKNLGGRTALHYAASKGRPSMVRLILQSGGAVNARCKLGATPLHRACSAGQTASVQVLVEEGKAAMEARENTGQTPLFVAAACGHRSIALYLISKGASPEAEDKEGETPLSAAAQFEGLRDSMVDVALGRVDIDEMLGG